MINPNYLGHDLLELSDYKSNYNTIYLYCRKCNSAMRYYKDTGYYHLSGKIHLLTCDEIIIKNIIE